MRVVLLLAGILLLSGCLSATQDAPAFVAQKVDLGPKPTMTKFSFDASAPPSSPLDPVPVVGAKPAVTHELAIPEKTGKLRLALDLATSGSGGDITITILDSTGKTLASTPQQTATRKLFLDIDSPAPGAGEVRVASRGTWKVGIVATFFPEGFEAGHVVTVAFPEQTKIDHSFQPGRIDAKPGESIRITLFDDDPHAGIDNLQHNLDFPTLGIKTEGRTTWGEARVLDMVAPTTPGEYTFQCEFHKFTGVLVVKA